MEYKLITLKDKPEVRDITEFVDIKLVYVEESGKEKVDESDCFLGTIFFVLTVIIDYWYKRVGSTTLKEIKHIEIIGKEVEFTKILKLPHEFSYYVNNNIPYEEDLAKVINEFYRELDTNFMVKESEDET